ncbi:unnamed protein product [Caenorhabditis auriculariae]|uniref:Tyrosine-protein kinase n=1 Tax=Caenorhabditis auriculariae TaxID=2777116 RepID=A0A8S1GMS0_9PELO|nr:unnamed protein product [Caenorhabditis auriculariae]
MWSSFYNNFAAKGLAPALTTAPATTTELTDEPPGVSPSTQPPESHPTGTAADAEVKKQGHEEVDAVAVKTPENPAALTAVSSDKGQTGPPLTPLPSADVDAARKGAAKQIAAVTAERAIAEEEKLMKELEFYHGFLPREDIFYLLRNDGDYILRVSEVPVNESNRKEAVNRREIILSVMTELHHHGQEQVCDNGKLDPARDHHHETKLRNVVVRRNQGKYSVEASRYFDTIRELVMFYAEKGQANGLRMLLKTPIKLQTWEYLHSAVKMGSLLGEGAYGEVRQGVLRRKGRNVDVAVKLTKGAGDLSKVKIREMMKEARLMRNFKHKNIVRIFGVAVDEQPLYILLELVKGGALNTYLQKNGPNVLLKERLAMCQGAAHGLEYLHAATCIHRDIAARNCLYSNDKIIKISDFGLSRLGNTYKLVTPQKLPIKWLAPETITTLVFSLKTDTYSYGVMCYEVFSDGCEPWDHCTNTDAKKNVVSGKHLTIPDICPDRFKNFIYEKIYVKDPNKRVSMADVSRFIDALMLEYADETQDPKGPADRSSFMPTVATTAPSVMNPLTANITAVVVPLSTRKAHKTNTGYKSKKQ